MKPTKEISGRDLKIVEWSEADRCFVGRCPGLFFGGCHGDDEAEVYRELCGLVEVHVAALQVKKEKLPAATS